MNKFLAILWSALLIYSAYSLTDYYISSINSQKSYEEIKTNFNAYEELKQNLNMINTNFDDGNLVDEPEEKVITERFKTLIADVNNEDIIGWIKISDTAIDYPVVKTDNNDFYLKNDVYKQPDKAGAIFMDFRNSGDFDDFNTIIYGHNMKNGSMFKSLLKYKDEDFFDTHPTIEYSTLYEDTQWEVFSAYVTSTDFYYIETDFPSEEDYQSFLDSIVEKSLYAPDFEVSATDTILTLSTCAYDFNDARFVVHARKK